MAKFVMLGKYSAGALKGISKARTGKGIAIIKKCGGRVISMLALLGNYDLLFVLDFPSNAAAMKASLKLSKLTGIGFTTSPAVTIEEFDRLGG